MGDRKIRKGGGMELDQLSKSSSYEGHRRVHLHPFGLDLLIDAFQLRETTSADLPLAGIGLSSGASNLKNDIRKRRSIKRTNTKIGRGNRILAVALTRNACQAGITIRRKMGKPRTDGNGGFLVSSHTRKMS